LSSRVLRIGAVWLAGEPIDMRTGVNRLLAGVAQVFGATQVHHGVFFSGACAPRVIGNPIVPRGDANTILDELAPDLQGQEGRFAFVAD
jgi:hypothetical protein